MSTVKALVNAGGGQAEVRDVPYPSLPTDNILVKTTAWAVNPDDPYHLGLEGEEDCTGCVVGLDYAGVVLEVGKDVTRGFKVGDRVAGVAMGQNLLDKAGGSFAEVIAVKGDVQMRIPHGISDVDAATQGVAVVTFGQAFYRDLNLPFPSATPSPLPCTLIINGGSTSMGIEGIQLAKLSGVTTVIATSSPANMDYVKSYGADHVLDYNSPTLVEEVQQLVDQANTGEEGYQLHGFDAYPSDVSAGMFSKILGEGSKYVTLISGYEKTVKELNPAIETSDILAYSAYGDPFMYEKVYFDVSPSDFELHKTFLPIAEGLLDAGKLKAPRVYLNRGGSGLEAISIGLEDVATGKVSGGKLVYTP